MAVSLSPLGGTRWQFFDDAGAPLVNGKLYTYLAGTTDTALTYTDSSGETANDNPIVLDNTGMTPNEIWLPDTIRYNFVLKTTDDTPLRAFDNVPGMGAASIQSVLSGATGALLVGYQQGSTGSVTQNVQARLRNDFVCPEDFGAVGDGQTDDTVALLATLASGKDVQLTAGKTYLHSAVLPITTKYQRVMGSGVIKTLGAINSFNVLAEGVELDVVFNSPGQTAGYAIYASGADNTKIHRAYIIKGFGGLYVESTNTFVVDYLWGKLNGPGVKWYGSPTKRSDVLVLNFVLVDPGNTEYGLDWDGNCHSLEVKYLGIVGGKGAVIRNTAGGATYPAIGKFGHIEVDYSTTHAVDIQAGLDFDFVMPYILGAAGDGFRIAATINAYEVRITGGKTVGNTGYGINNLSTGAVLVSGSVAVYTNTAGNYNGLIWCQAPRLQVDTYFYSAIVSGQPNLSFDNNDYISYDRTNNDYNFQIGGTGIFKLNANYGEFFKPVYFPIYTVATLPAGGNGMRAFVSDSSVTTFATAVAGGGTAFVPVYYNGGWFVG